VDGTVSVGHVFDSGDSGVPLVTTLLNRLSQHGGGHITRADPNQTPVSRDQLLRDITAFASRTVAQQARDEGSTWVALKDTYLFLVGAVGSLHVGSTALVESNATAAEYEVLAAACPPRLLYADDPGAAAYRWARERGITARLVDAEYLNAAGPSPSAPAAESATLQFFTSATTGSPKCVSIQAPQLFAAIDGVAGRLRLGPGDVSLSLAPLTHTLGLITTVLVPLLSGGSVVFADLAQPRLLRLAVAAQRPTWCAASPGAHRLLLELARKAALPWPSLRFLRSSAAPLPRGLSSELEEYFGVPFVNAYVKTEAPGEIASQGIEIDRRPGTVGKPTLCEVEIRTEAGRVPAGYAGEVWICGPNVVIGPGGKPADGKSWVATGDLGELDSAGFLRLTGRVDDLINRGGVKISPADVEAAALEYGPVKDAVAFPIPDEHLGQTIGLLVEPRDGEAVDESSLRRFLMTSLPRQKWPARILVSDRMPVNRRGKVVRQSLWKVIDQPPRESRTSVK
jgi:acyl-CoA synthetase (AMP-forming)/AMP-acid ligase II